MMEPSNGSGVQSTSQMNSNLKIAILDDYQNVARSSADWSSLPPHVQVTAFHDHQSKESDIIERLLPYQVISVMRERTPLSGALLKQLPNLKLIVSTGPGNRSIDQVAADELGIIVRHTGFLSNGAPELTWGLLLAATRHLPREIGNVKSGRWQSTVGKDLSGQTIGIIGLGNIGRKIAAYAKAFDMNVLAWSPNLTEQSATEAGAIKVTKAFLFANSDFITIHIPLNDSSVGLVSEPELNLMKRSAMLINTSRGPIVNEKALIEALVTNRIAGAILDVFNVEPLADHHPFRHLANVTATPHIGYVTENTYKVFYEDTVKAIKEWILETEALVLPQ